MLRKILTPKDERVKFDLKSVDKGIHKLSYRGVKAARCPFDYTIYQMIIFELKPDLIIEIGTNLGGGALYMADLLNILGEGTIHTIDIKDSTDPLVRAHPRIKLFTEGWQKYDLKNAQGFKKILVIEDGSHIYQDTLAAMEKFAPVVSKNSYFLIEDGIINALGAAMEKKYKGGPLKAIREFLAKHPEYEVDRKWCDFFGENATYNVNGYLKKVR
jgi:cephalosporin hydroxylase